MVNAISQNLIETKEGVNLPPPLAENIWGSNQDMIVSHLMKTKESNKFYYLLQDDLCYGIIRLKTPTKIDTKEFKELSVRHKLSYEDRNKWWPNKDTLFAYSFDKIVMFDEPKGIKLLSDHKNDFVQEFEFIEDNDKAIIKRVENLSDNKTIKNNIPTSDLLNVSIGFNAHKSSEPIELASVEGFFEGDTKHILHKIFGEPYLILKNGEEVEIFNSELKNVTHELKDIGKEVFELSERNLAITGEINEDELYVTDILYFDEFLGNKSFINRLEILHKLNFNKNIKEIGKITTENFDDTKKAYTMLKNLPDSNGVRMNNYEISSGCNIIVENSERNEKFFDSWNPTMAYFLGFISSDGHLEEDRNRIEVKISSLDKSILEKLGKALGKENFGNKDGTSRFRFGSTYMISRLKKLGMTKDKPSRRTHNKVPGQHKWMFARGCFDADGSVPDDRLQVDSGNKHLLKWLVKLFKTTGADIKYYDYDTYGKIVVLKGDGDAQKVLNKLYSGNSGVGLKRKGDKKIKNESEENKEKDFPYGFHKPDGTGPHGRGLGPGEGKGDGTGLKKVKKNEGETISTSPGIDSVQGSKIDKKKKPNQKWKE